MPYFFSYLASKWPWGFRSPNPPLRLAYVVATWLVLLAVPSGQLWAQTSCTQTSTLGYYEANSTNTTVVEKRAATESVLATSFTYGGYSSTAGVTDIFRLSSEQQGTNLDGRQLVWREQNAGAPGTGNSEVDLTSPYNAKVTLTFSRPVTNLTFVLQDIDRSINGNGGSNFTDELNFYALNGSTPVRLAGTDIGYGADAAPGTGTAGTFNTLVQGTSFDGLTQDAVRGTALNGGVGNNPSRAGNVTVRFASPVTSVRLTFRNLSSRSDVVSGGSALRLQTIGIEQISWCSRADLTTTISTPTPNSPVTAGTTGTFNVGFSNVGDLTTAATTARVQLPTGLQNVSATNGGIYNSSTGYVTYPTTTVQAYGAADVTSAITFAAPATGPVSATATITSATPETPTPSPDPNPNSATTAIAVTPVVLTGYVFEDVNYGGRAGRPRTASGASVRPGATVELYSSAGAFLASTTTDASGQYAFNAPAAGATYSVRVVNATVTSSRNTNNIAGLLPVQTYNGTTTRVGGENPAFTDAPANNGSQTLAGLNVAATSTAPAKTAESLGSATIASGATSATGPDFGFNFDTVVNTNDFATSGTAAQGSLRQFILNSNALTGTAGLAQSGSNAAGALPAAKESSIFMIPDGLAHAGLLAAANGGPASQLSASGVAAIATVVVLPAITSANTNIDGTTQTLNIGNTNNVTLGIGGTVGTAAAALGQLNGPEVQLRGTRSYEGLTVLANSVTVRGLSIYGFTNDIGVGTDYTGLLVEQNVLGTTATSFTDPGAGVRSTQQGVNLYNSDNGTVRNNLIGFNGGMGVWVFGDINGANGNTISGNEIRGNGQEVNVNGEGLVFDGLELQGASTNNIVSGNLITATLGHGIDSYANTVGGNTITGNTISNNGQGIINGSGLEGSGLRIYGATNPTTITNNVLSGNNGSGVLVENTAAKVIISQNATFGNTRLGIDLVTNANISAAAANEYNGTTGTTANVTLNSATTTGGNALLNYPVITSATVVGTSLLVQGYAKAGAAIELFIAQANASTTGTPNNLFGQGATYLTTQTEGGAADTDARTGLPYSGAINGVNQGTDTNANGFSFLIPLNAAQQAAVTAGTLLTSTATLGGATSEFSGNASATVTAPLTGYVYEDVNYGGGAGRSRATAGTSAVVRPGAKVELYTSAGAYVSTAITDANGQYAFSVVPASYTVRVVDNSVLSSRGQATSTYSGDATTGYLNTLLPVQTYNGTTTRVGGENPKYTDALANTGSQTLANLTSGTTLPESIATVTVAQGASTNAGPDFGFNFDTMVNTNDVAVSGTNTQGSLRQFILNSKALTGTASLAQSGSNSAGTLPAGKETSIFMIPDGLAHAGLLAAANGGPASQLSASGVAVITPGTALPTITSANIFIDGSTQTRNIGNTNNVTLGTGGPVGTGAAAATLSTVNGPEVQLVGSPATSSAGNFGTGLDFAGSSTGGGVVGLAIYGFGLNGDNDNSGQIRIAAGGLTLTNNVIGTSATSFSDLGAGVRAVADGIRFTGGTAATTVSNNLIGYNGGKGISTNNGVTNVTISNNEVRGNAIGNSSWDGIDIQGSATIVTNNLIINNAGVGVDGYNSAGSNRISGNTVTGNGRGTSANGPNETAALRIYGPNNVISQNVINDNYGAGVLVQSGARTTTISQNAIYGNGAVAALNNTAASGQVGIDLNTATNAAAGTAPYVTLNSATTTGGNALLNYPILTSATVVGTNLVLKGYAKAGATIELFVAQANGLAAGSTTGNNFGQGRTYLTTLTEGATTGVTDTDGSTGQTYGAAGATINGFAQGTDTNANGFTFSIPLTAAQQAQVLAGIKLTATSTLSNATSEFSGIVNVNAAPVPNTLTNVSVPNNNAATVLSPNLSATANGTFNGAANSISYYTLTSLPTSGTLTYNGTVLTSANLAATQLTPALLNTLTYSPDPSFSGSVSFTYLATDANGVTSTTNNNGGTATSGPATYTIPVTQSADVTTALAGPTQVNAGQSVTYTATFTNNGAQTANGVTRVLTLPAGATLNPTQQAAVTAAGGTYSSGANTITYPALATLASGSSSVVSFTFTAPTPVGPATLTSTVGTNGTPNQGANNAPDVATLTLNVTEVANVSATVTAATTPVAAGGTGTFNVVFKNAGPQTANGTTFAVQLPTGLSGVSVTNPSGTVIGSYNGTTGIVTLSAPPTSLAPAGQAALNVSFTMPANGLPVTAAATVTTTTSEAGQTTDNVASATITSSPAFDLTTSLTGPTSVMTGNAGTLYVTTTNNGPSAAPGVVQTVSIGTGLSTASLFISNGGTYNSNTGVVTFPTLATLPSGQTVGNTITFVIPAASVTFEPTATVMPSTTGAGETNPANNTARLNGAAANTAAAQVMTTAATGATVNVYTTISSTSQIVTPGSAIAYTVVAGNAGNPAATAADVTTSVQLLPGLTGTTLTLGGNPGTVGTGANANLYSYTFNDNAGTSRTATYNSTTGLVSISTITALASGSARSFALVMTPPASVIGNGGQVLATSSVMTNLPDAMPADNLDAVRVLVSPTADLATVVTGPTSVVAGLPVTYGITFSNNGSGLGTSVVETAQLPRNLAAVTILDNTGAAVSGASYSAATGLVTFPTQTTLAAGTSQAYTVSFTAPNTTAYPVSAAISGSTADGNLANNSSSVTTTTSALADVSVAVSGPASAVVGNPVTYAVTTANNGPSAAAAVSTTLQLPSGVTQANVLAAPPGTTYAVAGGITTATFTSVSSLASGASVSNYLTFSMPNATAAPATGTATVATTTTESNAGNNQQAVQTDLAPATAITADLGTTIAYNGNPATVTVGSSLTLNVTFTNNSTAAVGSVVPRIYLPAGLSFTSITSDAGLGTGTYNSSTGVVTFAPITLAASTTLNSTIVLPAPASGPVVATSSIASNTTDPTPANNVASASVAITAAYDAVTTISGPAAALPASTAMYTVQTINNGPTASTADVTQTVTLPAGVTVVAGSISGGGTVSGSTITWVIPAGQVAGSTGVVTNTFAVTTPTVATTTFTLNASVTAPGESNTGNNTALATTTRTNQPPVALNVTNLLQSPQSNTAGPLLISPLAANDPQNSALTYKLTSLPTAASQGVLSYNDGTANGAYTTITPANFATLSLSAAQIATLKFDPVSNFVGNVFFTYTATDALTLTSNEALYTIRVGQDNNSTYAVAPTKGGSNPYQNADVLATAFDWNGGRYTSTGAISPTNGVGSVTLTSGTAPAGTTLYLVPTTGGGVTYSAGQVVVTDRTKLVAGSYPLTVQTVDADGGVNTVSFTITIGAFPLPVVLTAFTATAVANRDALLQWATASEKNNDHFEIERSFDGTSFVQIGTVAGKGTTTAAAAYTLTDAGVAAKATGPVYYRLRQVDFDGSATYSPVRSVSFTQAVAASVSLYPNPAQASTTLDLGQLPTTGTYQVMLLDATGRTVRTATLGGGLPQPLDLRELATGTYHVLVTGQLADGSTFKQTLRLIKD